MSFQPLAGISEGVSALRPRSGSAFATRSASAPVVARRPSPVPSFRPSFPGPLAAMVRNPRNAS